jgi:transposase
VFEVKKALDTESRFQILRKKSEEIYKRLKERFERKKKELDELEKLAKEFKEKYENRNVETMKGEDMVNMFNLADRYKIRKELDSAIAE